MSTVETSASKTPERRKRVWFPPGSAAWWLIAALLYKRGNKMHRSHRWMAINAFRCPICTGVSPRNVFHAIQHHDVGFADYLNNPSPEPLRPGGHADSESSIIPGCGPQNLKPGCTPSGGKQASRARRASRRAASEPKGHN